MNKNYEIELRGPLPKDKFDELVKLFDKEGKFIEEKRRILIDYSTFLEGGVENRKKDIRIRVTNGIPEIVIKIGKWGGIDQRKELSVTTKTGEFDTLVEIFGNLGYIKGMMAIRKSKVYQYKDIEFALVEVPNHSYYFEAEKMAYEDEDHDKLTEEIRSVCTSLGLEVFDKERFFEYIAILNKEANEIFEFSSYTPNYFKNRFGL